MATVPVIAPDLIRRPVPPEQVDDLLKLHKAVQKINSILDLEDLIDRIVNDVALSFGCLEANIYLLDAPNAEMVVAGQHGCTCHDKGYRLKVGKEGMVGYAAATRQMRYAPDVSKDEYYIPCEPEINSEVAIPLLVEGRLVGVFTAAHTDFDAFPLETLRLLQAFCSHVAVAVDNAQRFERERTERVEMSRDAHEARAIQQSLLPKSSPFIPGFKVSGLSIPAGPVGGDWYDFIAFDDGRWGLVLADVSGKGMAAALLMSATRAMLRSLASAACSPSEVLTELNRLLVDDFPSGKFVTLLYGVLDPVKRTLTFASAGHLKPLLVANGQPRFLDSERGMPLGLGFGDFSENEILLPEGAQLLFYSDGITEAEGPDEEEYGAGRLLAHVSSLQATTESIVEDVRSFANGAGLRDDATVILVKA